MIWLLLFYSWAHSAEIRDIPQIGPHYRILTLDKTENPQNLLAIYTKLKHDCEVETSGDEPTLGYYWLMDGEHYKRVHSLILRGIKQRLEVEKESNPYTFTIAFNDLKELNTDAGANPIVVHARKENGHCALEARLRLGPSDGNREIRLTNIHSEARKTFLPPFRKIVSVTLSGVDASTGEPVSRTYSAKR